MLWLKILDLTTTNTARRCQLVSVVSHSETLKLQAKYQWLAELLTAIIVSR